MSFFDCRAACSAASMPFTIVASAMEATGGRSVTCIDGQVDL